MKGYNILLEQIYTRFENCHNIVEIFAASYFKKLLKGVISKTYFCILNRCSPIHFFLKTLMLRVQQLTFEYSTELQFQFADFNCSAGESLLILGESGVGKTTLLHLLAGILSPKTGAIYIGDTDIAQLSVSQLDRFRGQHIGLVFQQPHFVASLSVIENLLMAQYLAGASQDKARINTLTKQLQIADQLHKKVYQLSQGQQQRLAIARALVNQPKVLLADEPTSSLDDTNCAKVISLLKEQAAQAHAALIIVTHDGRLKKEFDRQIVL